MCSNAGSDRVNWLATDIRNTLGRGISETCRIDKPPVKTDNNMPSSIGQNTEISLPSTIISTIETLLSDNTPKSEIPPLFNTEITITTNPSNIGMSSSGNQPSTRISPSANGKYEETQTDRISSIEIDTLIANSVQVAMIPPNCDLQDDVDMPVKKELYIYQNTVFKPVSNTGAAVISA